MNTVNATVHSDLHVTIGSRDYWANKAGGYVYEGPAGGTVSQGHQLCNGLSGDGNTIALRPNETVLDVLRYQYRQFRRAHIEARDRWGDVVA